MRAYRRKEGDLGKKGPDSVESERRSSLRCLRKDELKKEEVKKPDPRDTKKIEFKLTDIPSPPSAMGL